MRPALLAGLLPVLVLLLAGCERSDGTPPPSSLEAPARVESASGDGPPALEVGHLLGAEEAGLTVVEFSDFGCEACAEFARESLPALKREFVATGRVSWRFVPIRQGFYRGGDAARAAECAAEQEAFWEMHDLLLARQREWQSRGDPVQIFSGYAREAGADADEFASCYASDRPDAALRLNDLLTLSMGIRAVPMFLVGSRRIIGALEPARFAEVLREELGG